MHRGKKALSRAVAALNGVGVATLAQNYLNAPRGQNSAMNLIAHTRGYARVECGWNECAMRARMRSKIDTGDIRVCPDDLLC